MANCNVICNDQIGPLSKTNGDNAVDWPRLGRWANGWYSNFQLSKNEIHQVEDPYLFCMRKSTRRPSVPLNYQQCLQMSSRSSCQRIMRTWNNLMNPDDLMMEHVLTRLISSWIVETSLKHRWNVEAPKPWIKAKKKEAILGFTKERHQRFSKGSHTFQIREILGLCKSKVNMKIDETPFDGLCPPSMALINDQASQSRPVTIETFELSNTTSRKIIQVDKILCRYLYTIHSSMWLQLISHIYIYWYFTN